jgi:inosine-uridine nucleoside N-ribohydrolase
MQKTSKHSLINVILDTDINLDVDDAGALPVLHALADQEACNILAVGVSTSAQIPDGLYGAACVNALNTFYGRPDIPIGVNRGPNVIFDRVGKYAQKVAEAFPHQITSVEDLPDAWQLYRKVLISQPDQSVTMVSIGFLNNFQQLLQSPSDNDSPLTGQELVAAKVKEWVCMGGHYPKGKQEFNFNTYALATQYVLEHWPTAAVFVGGELGDQIKTGEILLKQYQAEKHPLAMCWQFYNGGRARASWDQIAVMYAVLGCSNRFMLSAAGRNSLVLTGAYIPDVLYKSRNVWRSGNRWYNRWFRAGKPFSHFYLRSAVSNEVLAQDIDQLMCAVR